MREIRELRGPLGLPVERDLHFDADYGAQRRRTPVRAAPSASEWVRRNAEYKPLSAYAVEARAHGRIVT
jgi:hypothetical protein